jgi:hypothetical protein
VTIKSNDQGGRYIMRHHYWSTDFVW